MMLQGVPAKDLVEHCEKYLYVYQDGRFSVKADAMNNMEKALAFDFMFYKLHDEAVKVKGNFFNPHIFLTMISSLIYSLMKAVKDPTSMEAYESTMNLALVKIKTLQNWLDTGQPQDDQNIIDEIVAIMNENKERTQPMLDLIQQIVSMKQGGNGGSTKPGGPKA